VSTKARLILMLETAILSFYKKSLDTSFHLHFPFYLCPEFFLADFVPDNLPDLQCMAKKLSGNVYEVFSR
jgi:hypothetical protein